MPSFRSQRLLSHCPEQMFDLVADVEKYPLFLPFCEALEVRRREPGGPGIETIVADMSIGYKAIRETFTSRVTLDRAALRIVVAYVDGPFKHLENVWSFRPGPDGSGCRVEFFIDYEFRNRLLGMLMGAMFDQAFRRFVSAFEARASVVYGAASGVTR